MINSPFACRLFFKKKQFTNTQRGLFTFCYVLRNLPTRIIHLILSKKAKQHKLPFVLLRSIKIQKSSTTTLFVRTLNLKRCLRCLCLKEVIVLLLLSPLSDSKLILSNLPQTTTTTTKVNLESKLKEGKNKERKRDLRPRSRNSFDCWIVRQRQDHNNHHHNHHHKKQYTITLNSAAFTFESFAFLSFCLLACLPACLSAFLPTCMFVCCHANI